LQIELGLSEIGISPQDLAKVKFVTDEGANFVKAIETYDGISCFAHNLNAVLRNTLEEEFLRREAPETWETLQGNRRAVKYLKKSFKAAQLPNDVHGFVKVRFNSLLRNLRSTFDQFLDVITLLRDSG